jgi:hypothetical protein
MLKPSCDSTKPDLSFIRDDPAVEAQTIELRANADLAENASDHTDNKVLKDILHKVFTEGYAAAEAAERSRDAPSASERAAAYSSYQDHFRAYQRAMRDARDHGDRTIFVPGSRLLPPPREPRPRSPHGPTRLTPGPEGDEDPRCGNQETEIKQGLWFMDKRFCPERNFLECYERAAGGYITDVTNGLCRVEPGPDDRNVVCKTPDKEKERNPLEPVSPEPPPGPVDGPPRPWPVKVGLKLDFALVPTELGGIMALLCQVDRCGPMQANPQARPRNPR